MAADDPLYLGSWERDRVLGTGGFGIVTLWKNKSFGEKIAIKKCRWGMNNIMTKMHKERWSREVDIMQRLSHPNVVRAVPVPNDIGEGLTSELPLLCMEFCSGGDLRQILNRPENCCGLREAEVRSLLSDIKAAVQYLHSQRITHRDLKPENIVLQERPNYPMAYKLIDLGYAKELDATSACSFVGTMQYLAPEFFLSSGYTSSVDYWSLGLVSHEAITGLRPFLPNAESAAEWIPKVEKKSSNDICVYEVPGSNKEIKYSQELFVENYISRCLREDLEKWLRLALEFNPKKRGRSQQDNKLAIFTLLDEILNKKIVTVFCVVTLSRLSYQVDSATAVSTLKLWIERDTKQPVGEQLLLLPSGKHLTHDHMAIDCWNPEEATMVYVFGQSSLSLPYVKVADRVPALVRWLMENPKKELPYHHQKHVWRHAVFFLRQEFELFQLFLEAYAVKMLSLLEQSYELSQLETKVSTEIEHLLAIHGFTSKVLEFDNKCYGRHLASMPLLSNVSELLGEWSREQGQSSVRVASCQEALCGMAARIRQAHQTTTQLQDFHDPGQNDLINFESLLKEGYKCYDNIRKRKDRTTNYASPDMARIVYNCFKQIDITLRNEDFGNHLKHVSSHEIELQNLLKALRLLELQADRASQEMTRCQYVRQRETWALIKRLATQKEQETKSQSNLSLNTTPHVHASLSTPSIPSSSPSLSLFVPPPPPRNPSPLLARDTQVPVYPSPPHSPNSNGVDAKIVSSPPPFISAPVTCPSTPITPVGFDTSPRQMPLSHTPSLQATPSSNFLLNSKTPFDTESLIRENANIRYAMQDSIISFTQCSNSIAECSLDWSFLDKFKK